MKFFGYLGHSFKTNKSVKDLIHGFRANWNLSSFTKNNLNIEYASLNAKSLLCKDQVTILIDGNIYNMDGCDKTITDFEKIYQGYQKWGFKDSLKKINGDFSIILFDGKSNELWLARDRFGIKPLYYHIFQNEIAFASRIRPLLSLPSVSGSYNTGFVARFAVSHYRYFDNFPAESPFENIFQLPAAHWLHWRQGKFSTGKYWALEENEEFNHTESDLAERYRDLFLDAVNIRFSQSKNPAFTLSGGMDSSSVLGSAVKLTGSKQHAFSSVYEDKTFDETDDIQSMLKDNVIKWHNVQIGNPNVFKLIREMIDAHDEPVATATWLSHWILSKKVSELGYDGIFGGLGGDELNAGEYEYFFYHFADLHWKGKKKKLDEEINKWIQYHDHPIHQKSKSVVDDYFSRCIDFYQQGFCLPEENRLSNYYSALNPEFFDINSFRPLMDHPFRSYLNNRTYQDLTRETIPCCIRAEDRQTTAHGINNFLPFLDYRLSEFMFRVPGKFKIRNGVTKTLLREAMRGILPEETRNRIKKTGWNAPAHQWFSGKGADQLQDMVRSQSFRKLGIYNLNQVEKIIQEHRDITENSLNKENHMMFLWQLVNLWTWLSEKNS